MGDEAIEQTLFVAKEVQVYKIPPRPSSGGHKSGDWKVADRIFQGRLRVLSIGEKCELRLEEPGRLGLLYCSALSKQPPFTTPKLS